MPMTREQRGRLGGMSTAARHDGRVTTSAARARFLSWDHCGCRVCDRDPHTQECEAVGGTVKCAHKPLTPTTDPDRLAARLRLHAARISMLGVAARRRRAA